MTPYELGQHGEQLAVNQLIKDGYSIKDRNYRFGKLEIDIIAVKAQQLCIVEVKTRVTGQIGEPYKAVTRTKQRQLIRAANAYIQSKNIHLDCRFDVFSIIINSYHTKIDHIENAFSP